MGWKFDQPMFSLSDEQEQKEILDLWANEKHGGLWEANNRLPMPMVLLMALIILTAFMMTMPIWGQRPNADNYKDFVALMDSPEVQRLATSDEKIKYVSNRAFDMADDRTKAALERHPLTWDDLLNIAPGIKEIQAGGQYPLNWYTVLGDRLVLANFEGAWVDVGGKTVRTRLQPWWDQGYTIDVFYVSYFVLTMVLVIKRLPHFSRKPSMK
ncbi:MAG: hypothetical protein OEZ43_02080 [Gammaproteobacteria bacterium]|nr:hypothetical protein [Gammaproteobacteria bacterium]